MFASIQKQILGFNLLLIILGGLLAALVYLAGNSISTSTSALVESDLPLQDNISALRFAIFSQKPILYEYYADTNREIFQKRFAASRKAIKDGLYMIPRDEQGQTFLTQLEFQTGQIDNLAEQLDKTLGSPGIDWDKARDILVEVSAAEKNITPLIDHFASLNKKHITDIGALAQSRMQMIIVLVCGFIAIILVTALLLGRNVKRKLNGQ